MAVISVLKPQVANMIAAGEVLDRPASAVKEMIENSIDAGADRIVVEIADGGRTMIKVTDNGFGMDKEDAENCFLRHATSKIKKEEDLNNIMTLGFRGEALASIAAVSEVTLETRTANNLSGTKVVIRGGKIEEVSQIGCNVGTSVTVRDIYFNTPARLKFLKSENTEGAYIAETVEKFIIASPHISFLFIKNNKEILYSAGDNNEKSNLLNIYKSDTASNLKEVSYEEPGIKIKGFIGNEKILKNNRKFQSFFVNGRAVRNKIFYSAVDEAVRERVMVGKYPFVILKIEISPDMVDVNVHPTKAEVKFSDDRKVYGAIVSALIASYRVTGFQNEAPVKEVYEGEKITFVNETPLKKENTPSFNIYQKETPCFREEGAPYNENFNEVKTVKFEALTPRTEEIEKKTEDNIVPNEQKKEIVKDYKIIGQIFSTFIIIEKGDTMFLLDQHAAHERLLFDKFLKEFKEKKIVSQPLLIPCSVNLLPTQYEAVIENESMFTELGFSLSEFSDNEIIVREVPFGLETSDIEEMISDIADMIIDNRNSLITYKQEKSLHMIACKAAVKANMSFDRLETEKLVDDVLNLQDANTCPHGRPLFVSFDRKMIEKQFKRI